MPVAYAEWRSRRLPAMLWVATSERGESRILPDGCMDLIWDGERVLVAGADAAVHVSRTTRAAPLAGLRFDPGIAPSVLGVPADALAAARVGLDALWHRATVQHWQERLAASARPIDELERIVAATMARTGDVPTWIAPVVRAVDTGASVGDIAASAGYTTRHLSRLANERFGYGLATLARVLRFQRALPRLRAGSSATDVAASVGYADASHLHRDVRALTGRPVAALRADEPAPGRDEAAGGMTHRRPLRPIERSAQLTRRAPA